MKKREAELAKKVEDLLRVAEETDAERFVLMRLRCHDAREEPADSIATREPLGRQYSLKPARCHAITVAGLTMTNTSAQCGQKRRRAIQKTRSTSQMRGPPLWTIAASCCRRAMFSSGSPWRERKAERSGGTSAARRRNTAREDRGWERIRQEFQSGRDCGVEPQAFSLDHSSAPSGARLLGNGTPIGQAMALPAAARGVMWPRFLHFCSGTGGGVRGETARPRPVAKGPARLLSF
jgi:hypothetical protein